MFFLHVNQKELETYIPTQEASGDILLFFITFLLVSTSFPRFTFLTLPYFTIGSRLAISIFC